jgi:hypothetical protein
VAANNMIKYEGMATLFKAGDKLRNIEALLLSNNQIKMPRHNAIM